MRFRRLILALSILAGIIATPAILKASSLNAEVSGLKAELKSTGTVPFNNESGVGRDTTANDQIVRTFDEVSYDISFATNDSSSQSIALEDLEKYDEKRASKFRSSDTFDIEVSATIPNVSNRGSIEATWETSNFKKGDFQLSSDKKTLKFYVRNMTVGQLYTKGVILKVNDCENGKVIQPTVSAKIVGKLTGIDAVADKPVTVTTRTNLNLRLATGLTANKVEVDGSSGRLHQFVLGASSHAEIADSRRGTTIPSGPIELILRFDLSAKNISTQETKVIDLPVKFYHTAPNAGKDTFNQPIGSHGMPIGTGGGDASVNSGNVQVEELGNNKFKITLSDYVIGNSFPIWNWGGDRVNPHYKKDYMNFISQALEFFVPFYNNSDASYDVYSKAVIESVKYTDKQGNILTQETNTGDNTNTRHLPEYLPGTLSASAYYSGKTFPTWASGNATAQVNENLDIVTMLHLASGADAFAGGGKQLTLFDGREFELTSEMRLEGSSLYQQPKYKNWYGIGKVTKEEMCAGFVKPDGFTWYETLAEAKANENPSEGLYISAIGSDVSTPLQGQGWPHLRGYYKGKIRPSVPVGSYVVSRVYGVAYPNADRSKKVGPTSTSKYTPSELNDNGDLVPGSHSPASSHGGNTIKVVPYTVHNSTEILTKENGAEKVNYQLKDGNIVDMKSTPSIRASAPVSDDFTMKIVIPKGLEYVEGSSSRDITNKTTDSNGNTILEYVYSNHNNTFEPVTYQLRIPLVTKDRAQFEIKTISEAAGDKRNEALFRTSSKTITIIADASMQITKRVDKSHTEMNEEFKYTLEYANTSDKDYFNGVFLDILPFNGDTNGSNYTGSYTIKDIKLPSGVTVQGTNQEPSTIKNNPLNTGVTDWSNGSKVTALKFEVDAIPKTSEAEISFVLVPTDNMPDDIYKNQYFANLEGIDIMLKSNVVNTEVISRGLKGKVWFDSNANGYIDSGEEGMNNTPVELVNTSGQVVKTTTTNSEGDYNFEYLAPTNYSVRFGTPAGTNATVKKEDSNVKANHTSLVNGKYQSSEVTLDKFQDEDKVRNFGVVPNVKITKVMPTESVSLGSQATWEIKVENKSRTGGKVSEVTVIDDLPTGVEVLTSSISHNGVYDEAKHEIEWTLTNMPADSHEVVSFTGIIRSEKPSDLRNVAMVKPYGEVPTDVVSGTVDTPIVKSEKRSSIPTGIVVNENDEIEYTIRVSNVGNVAAKNVRVVDTVPTNSTLVPNSITGGGVLNSGDVIKWTIPNIEPQGVAEVKFKVRVNEASSGVYQFEIHNTATVNDVNTNTIEHRVLLPHLTQTKSSNIPTSTILEEGQELTYNITVTNDGYANKGAFTVTDEIPNGMTLVPNSINEGGTANGRVVTWNVADLQPNQSKTFSFKVTLDNLPSGESHKEYDNSATVDGTRTNVVSHTLQKAIINYSKSSNVAEGEVEEGQEIEYTITVSNTGRGNSKAVRVEDVIPAGTTYVQGSASHNGTLANNTLTWNLNSIPGNSEVELKFKVTVNQLGDDIERAIVNVAQVNGNNTNNINHVVRRARIEHEKSITNLVPGQTILEGQEIEYTIRVANTGAKAKKNLVIADSVPDGTTLVEGSVTNGGVVTGEDITWTIPTLDANSEIVVKFKVTINAIPEDEITGLITNTATVDSEETNEVQTAVDSYRKRTNKLVSSAVAVAGDKLNYKIEVSNEGSLPLVGVTVTDTIPENTKIVLGSISNSGRYNNDTRTITWDIPRVEPGQKVIVSFDVLILKEARNTNLHNTAIVDGLPTNEVITEVVSRALTGNVWYDSNEDGRMQASEYRVPNIGVQLLKGDGTPIEGMTTTTDENGKYVFEDLQVGDYKVEFDLPKGTTPTDILFFAGDDTNHTDETLISKSKNLILKQDKVPLLNLGVKPVLKLEKSANVDYVLAGDVIEYTLKVTNTSYMNIPVEDFDIKDLVPEGLEIIPNDDVTVNGNEVTWHIDTLAQKESKTVTFRAKVVSKSLIHFTNQASVPRQDNVTETVLSNQVETPVVRISKLVDRTEGVREGEDLTYIIRVSNNGTTEATNIPVSDTISDKLEVKKLSISNGGKLVGNTINWNIKSLKGGETIDLTFKATVKDLAEGLVEDTIPNRAVVSGHETNEVTTGVVKPRIELSKRVDKTNDLEEGDTLTYTVTVSNTGTASSDKVTVTDAIPQGTTLIEDSISDNGYFRNGEVTWKMSSIDVAETKDLSFRVTIDELEKGITTKIIENTANVNGEDTNKVESIVSKGNLVFHKESSEPFENELSPNDKITYKVVIGNTGDRALHDIVVKDKAPEGTTLDKDSIVQIEGVEQTLDDEGNIVWNIPTLKAGDIFELLFTVTVNELTEEGVYTKVIPNVATVNDMETNEVQNVVKIPHLVTNKESSVPLNNILGKGSEVTYTITVSNDGDATMNKVNITDEIPKGTKFVKSKGTLEDNKVVWNIGPIKPGETQQVDFTVVVEDFKEDEIAIENTALVNDEPTNKVVNIARQHKFNIHKFTTTKKAKVNREIGYGIQIMNTGETTMKGVVIGDVIPEHTQYVEGSASDSGEFKDNKLSWKIDSLEPGQTETVTFRVKVTEKFDKIVNVAKVNGLDTNEVIHNPEPNVPLAPEDTVPSEPEEIKPPKDNPIIPEGPIKDIVNQLPQTGTTALTIGIPVIILTGIAIVVYRRR